MKIVLVISTLYFILSPFDIIEKKREGIKIVSKAYYDGVDQYALIKKGITLSNKFQTFCFVVNSARGVNDGKPRPTESLFILGSREKHEL
jgi:hypothetical protein